MKMVLLQSIAWNMNKQWAVEAATQLFVYGKSLQNLSLFLMVLGKYMYDKTVAAIRRLIIFLLIIHFSNFIFHCSGSIDCLRMINEKSFVSGSDDGWVISMKLLQEFSLEVFLICKTVELRKSFPVNMYKTSNCCRNGMKIFYWMNDQSIYCYCVYCFVSFLLFSFLLIMTLRLREASIKQLWPL